MAHRIRYAMSQEPLSSKLRGVIEIDETYVGGKLRVGPQSVKPGERPRDRAAGVSNKAPECLGCATLYAWDETMLKRRGQLGIVDMVLTEPNPQMPSLF